MVQDTEKHGIGDALKSLFVNRLGLIVLSVLVVRAVLNSLSGWATFPPEYGCRHPLLLGVYFVDVLIFGAAHVVGYLFLVSSPLLDWELGSLTIPLSLVGFVITGFIPYVIGFVTIQRWKLRLDVIIPLAIGLAILVAIVPFLLLILMGLIPCVGACLAVRYSKTRRGRNISLAMAFIALAAFNLFCGFIVLLGMIPTM